MKPYMIKIFIIILLYGLNNGLAFQNEDSHYHADTLSIHQAQKNNYRYLGDLLSYSQGLWIRDSEMLGQWASCRIRNSHVNQVLLLVDGQPINDPWTGTHNLNLVPVEMIDRIEVFPGLNPFGKTAIGGIVNVVSRNLDSYKPFTKVVYRSGKNGFSDLDVTFGQKLSSKLEIISGVLLQKYGELIPSQTYSAQKTRAKIQYRPLSNLTFRYSVLHNKYNLDLPYTFPVPGDTLDFTTPHRKRIQYNHSFQGEWNFWKLGNRINIYHTAASQENYDKPLSLRVTIPTYQTSIQFLQNLKDQPIHLTWGLETQLMRLQIPDSTQLNETINRGFLLGVLPFTSSFKTLFQLHAHRSTDGIWRLLPAAQMNFVPFQNTELYLGYSQGIRDPSLGERFGYIDWSVMPVTHNQAEGLLYAHPFVTNPELKPETSETVDIGLQCSINPRFQLGLKSFLRTTHHLIEIDTNSSDYQYVNKGGAHFKGIEGQIHWNLWRNLDVNLSLFLQESTADDGGNLLERPNVWAHSGIYWHHTFFRGDLDVFLHLNYRFFSEYWSLIVDTLSEPYSQMNGPAHLLDIKISFIIIKRGSFTFAVDNIFDTGIHKISLFPMPGRSTRIGFSWELFD
jgi:outer membrane receptor protein involved in Fe transport